MGLLSTQYKEYLNARVVRDPATLGLLRGMAGSRALRTPTRMYRKLLRGAISESREQLGLLARLDVLQRHIVATDRFIPARTDDFVSKFFSRKLAPRSVYVHGGVGTGKSLCMDIFYDSLPSDLKRGKRRVHFHEFMLDFHKHMHEMKQDDPACDALPRVADKIAATSRVLCFDEFQVADIADAVVLKRLFEHLFSKGVIVVTTSNRHPKDLYTGGLNRSLFLPFIDLIFERTDVINLTGCDYRRVGRVAEEQRWHVLDSGEDGEEIVLQWSLREPFGLTSVEVAHGREMNIMGTDSGVAKISFEELCGRPLGAADYLALCSKFDTIILTDVPTLSAGWLNEARRFIIFIDAVYEGRVKLFVTSESPIEDLFSESFLDIPTETEDIQDDREGVYVSIDSSVSEEGGSSGMNSTMIAMKSGEQMEWSATGIVKASLASAVQDVNFSFARALSRLVEMQSQGYGHKSTGFAD